MSHEVPDSALDAALRAAGEMICHPGRQIVQHGGCARDSRDADPREGFFVAGAVSDLTGRPASAFGSLADFFATLHVDDRGCVERWCRADQPPGRHCREIVRLCQPDGSERRCEVDIAAHRPFADGRVLVLRLVPASYQPVGAAQRDASQRDASQSDASQSDGRRLLLADDSIQTVSALKTLLTRRGYRVRIATDGLTALQVAREFRPHAAVLDVGMPGANGLEVAAALRHLFKDRPLTLIALSGYSRRGDRARAVAAGFDHHLLKPASIATIIALLAEA